MPGARSGRQLLRQEVVDGIKRYILENKLRPGDSLPTEPALCEALGASRSSVREAVKILNALDIVEVRHGHGTYVGRLSLSALVESLTFRGLLSPDDDFQVLADLVDVRELFERGMADRIVSSLTADQLDALDGLVQRMREVGAGDGQGFVEADRAFHALLVAPLGNQLIGQLSVAFWDVYSIVAPTSTASRTPTRRRRSPRTRASSAPPGPATSRASPRPWASTTPRSGAGWRRPRPARPGRADRHGSRGSRSGRPDRDP